MRRLTRNLASALIALALPLTFAACSSDDDKPAVDPGAVTGVELPAAFTARLGKTRELTAAVTPADATNKKASWTSNNPAVAAVSGTGLVGRVTGVAVGAATITVTTEDGGKTASCLVTVEDIHPDVYIAGYFGLYKGSEPDPRFGGGAEWLTDIVVDGAGVVHASGAHVDWDDEVVWAAYYKNGVRTLLPTTHGALTAEANTNAIFVDGADVYVAGYETFYAEDYSGYGVGPRLWKNGVSVPLESREEHEDEIASVMAVRVHGGDVYAAGHTDALDGFDRPAIWKNGKQYLNAALEDSIAADFCVHPSGVLYVLTMNPWVWDGEPPCSVWRVQPDLKKWDLVTALDSDYDEFFYAGHLVLDGDDWYVTGSVNDDGYYWKNSGTPVMLPRPANTDWAGGDDIFVLDGDVYIAGCVARRDNSYGISLWLNGALVPGAIPDAFDSPYYSDVVVRGLYVK